MLARFQLKAIGLRLRVLVARTSSCTGHQDQRARTLHMGKLPHTLLSSPPLQLPECPQSTTFWTDRKVGGHTFLRLMFMRSASEDVEAIAQQLPQYWGMCWLRMGLR